MSDELGQDLGDTDRLLLVFGYLGPLAFVSLLGMYVINRRWTAR